MRVKDCQKCKYYKRRTWSHKHYSANYHPVGMTHAYGFCEKHKERCLLIKRCQSGYIGADMRGNDK